MSYENEQKRLTAMWAIYDDIPENAEEPLGFESDGELLDHVSERLSNSDSAQEIEPSDEIENEHYEPLDVDRSVDNSTSNDRPTSSSNIRRRYMWGKDGKTKWAESPGNQAVRTRSVNIVTHLPGPKKTTTVTAAKTPLACWSLFVDNVMLDDTVKYTNEEINHKSQNYFDKHMIRETNTIELKAALGLLYLAGVFRSSRQNLEDLWANDGTGVDIFRSTMPLKRFQILVACFRFDCAGTRNDRRRIDKLAPIRAIFERFINHCQECYTPSEYMTIDEKLEAFRGRCGIRQYIPNKPAKYGIKVFALVDARTFYIFNLGVYVGKQPDGLFPLSNKPDDIVLRLVEPIREYKLTAVCTLKKNKREIPPVMLAVRGREERISMFGFQSDIMLVSYIPKKGKNVLLFSTLHHDRKIDTDTNEWKKPEVITFYNFTKGGVDVVDELSGTYSVSRNSRRWPLTLFYSILNSAAINAMIIWKSNNNDKTSKLPRRKLLKELGLFLVKEYREKRQENPYVRRELRRQIAETSGSSDGQGIRGDPFAKRQKVSRRCCLCPRKADRKSFYTCHSCNHYICMDHCSFTCDECQVSNSP
ncbi:piggyBac transposable element-derived protein 4-like [Euwallacea similis]|uniref:piggyBac transposable element-derived protein 4-like n=1 Tax=Euwallacea similis TaxID=1736056 RepID=UPI00344C9C37